MPSSERWRSSSGIRNQPAKVRVGVVAARQWGRMHWLQLRDCGVGKATVSRWVADGYLTLVHPCVYAVGHLAPSYEADLFAAVLCAGPGAMLSHIVAAWWWRLTDRRPTIIDVSAPRRCESRQRVRVHSRRTLRRVLHNRMPATTVAQTLLDVAATE